MAGKRKTGTILLVTALVVLVAFIVALGVYAWNMLGDAEISTHGLIAMGLGILFTCALGIGLMALVFYSSRHGYDDDAG